MFSVFRITQFMKEASHSSYQKYLLREINFLIYHAVVDLNFLLPKELNFLSICCGRSFYWAVKETLQHRRSISPYGRSLCLGPSKPLPATCVTLARISSLFFPIVFELRFICEIRLNQINSYNRFVNMNLWSSLSNRPINSANVNYWAHPEAQCSVSNSCLQYLKEHGWVLDV